MNDLSRQPEENDRIGKSIVSSRFKILKKNFKLYRYVK